MTKEEFKDFIVNELTMSGALKQMTLPDKEIYRIIDNETRQLYDIDPDALKQSYTIVPNQYFYTPEFRATRTLKFPKCVKSVGAVVEMTGRSVMWGINDPDISFSRAFQADLWMSPMGSDTMTFRTIQWSMWSQMKKFNLRDIQHSWSRTEHTLLIQGHDPRGNVFIQIFEEVPNTELWEDPWVRKWIAAKCKKQLTLLLGIFTYNLIGGVTINSNLYEQQADKDIEECKEYFKGINNPDWFITF